MDNDYTTPKVRSTDTNIEVKNSATTLPEKVTEKGELCDLVKTSSESLALDVVHRAAYCIPALSSKLQPEIMKAFLTEMKPQDVLESMLYTQIYDLHALGLQFLGMAYDSDMRCHQDPDLNNGIKLLRLQHETIDTLLKLKRGGEQKVTVQHVQVNNGGKAVVGQFYPDGGIKTAYEDPHGV